MTPLWFPISPPRQRYSLLWIVIAFSFCWREYVHECFFAVQLLISLMPLGTKFNSAWYFITIRIGQGRLSSSYMSIKNWLLICGSSCICDPWPPKKNIPPWLSCDLMMFFPWEKVVLQPWDPLSKPSLWIPFIRAETISASPGQPLCVDWKEFCHLFIFCRCFLSLQSQQLHIVHSNMIILYMIM